jgi:hypothetical protein
MYNNYPLLVDDLNNADLHSQFDQNGVVSTGSSTAVPAPVVGSLGQVGDNVVLQIQETVSVGNSWTSLLTSRAFSMAKMVSSISSYFFEVTTSYLKWTDTEANSTTLNFNKGATQLAFSSSAVNVYSGENLMISSVDSTHLEVGNSFQALKLNGDVSTTSLAVTALYDKTASLGSAGQVLTSTSTGVEWVSNGTGAVNTVDRVTYSPTALTTGTPLILSSSTLPAGSYLVNYEANLQFSPVVGAGIQESLMQVDLGDGDSIYAITKDDTVRNIVGTKGYWVQCSSVVVLSAEGTIKGSLLANWIGGAGGTITASVIMTSTAVGI